MTAGGEIVVAGALRTIGATPADVGGLLMKFTTDGALVWRTALSTANVSVTRKVVADAAGNAYVLGMGTPAGGPAPVAAVTKVSPGGSVLWTWFDALGIGIAGDLVLTADGRLVALAGSAFNASGYAVIDPSTGIARTASLSGDVPTGAAGDAAGNIYMVSSGPRSSTLRKLAPDGSQTWQVTLGSVSVMRRVTLGSDSLPVVGGATPGAGYTVWKYNADGSLLWQNSGAGGTGVSVQSIQLDGSGNVLLSADAAIVTKLLPTGQPLWTTAVPLGGSTSTSSLALGSDGSPFVTANGGLTARIAKDVSSAPPPPPPSPPPPPPSIADLQASLGPQEITVRRGDTIQYIAEVKNAGPLTASAVTFKPTLPDGAALDKMETSHGTCDRKAMVCDIGSLAPGESVTVFFYVRLRTLGRNEIRVDFTTPEDLDLFNNTSFASALVVKRF